MKKISILFIIFAVLKLNSCFLFDFPSNNDSGKRNLFIVQLSETGITKNDYYYLSLIAAGKYINNGEPSLLAIENINDLQNDPYIKNYLYRYNPDKAFTINFTADVPHAEESNRIDGSMETVFSKDIALKFWSNSSKLVAVKINNYENAIQGAAMASHLNAPLLYYDSSNLNSLKEVIEALKVNELISIGGSIGGLSVTETNVNGPLQIIAYLNGHGEKVKYFAITNPGDHAISNQDGTKLSLSAPIIASRRKGVVIPIQNTNSSTGIFNELKGMYTSLTYHPDYLAIIGSHTGLPMHFYTEWPDIGTDYYYTNFDNDLFPDIAVGRINSRNIFHASLVASRISTYDNLKDGTWDKNFVQGGNWNFPAAAPLFDHYGYNEYEYLVGTNLNHHDLEAAVIIHSAHSNHLILGGSYDYNNADAVLSPAVIVSLGCSVAGIYQSGNKYISRRLQRMGAVSFVGTSMPGTSVKEQTILGFINKMLEGKTLGQAFKHGLSSQAVRSLNEPGNVYALKEMYNLQFFGDPAMVIMATTGSPSPLPTMEETSSGVRIDISNKVLVEEFCQAIMNEWGFTGSKLYSAQLPGIDSLTDWGGKYDVYKHVYTAAYKTNNNINSVNQVGSFPSPLGKVGSHHNDYHQDGSRTVYWHVRVFDYDQENNVVKNRLNSIEFKLN